MQRMATTTITLSPEDMAILKLIKSMTPEKKREVFDFISGKASNPEGT